MMLSSLLAAATPAAAAAPISLNPVTLFMDADIIVKLVMIGLLLASVWTWSIIVSLSAKIRNARKNSASFEEAFWQATDMEGFYKARGKEDVASAQVLSAGINEWRRSTAKKNMDTSGTRDRLSTAMSSAVAGAIDKISDRLNILATIGSVAPFVGLLGGVGSIVRSSAPVAGDQNPTPAVAARGLAGAFSAPASGFFAASPAVIANTRLSHGVNRLEARLHRFADGLYTTFSRELEG